MSPCSATAGQRLAEAPSGCPVAQERDAGAKGLALHQTQARHLGRVREEPLAAPEHDWIGEEPVLVDEEVVPLVVELSGGGSVVSERLRA